MFPFLSFFPRLSLPADVSGGFVICLFCEGTVGELHEEHNNSAGEALWHPQLPNRRHWRELRGRWVELPATVVILLFCSAASVSWAPLPPLMYEWVTEVFKLQIKDSSGSQEEDRSACVCVSVYVCMHSESWCRAGTGSKLPLCCGQSDWRMFKVMLGSEVSILWLHTWESSCQVYKYLVWLVQHYVLHIFLWNTTFTFFFTVVTNYLWINHVSMQNKRQRSVNKNWQKAILLILFIS